MLNFISSYNIKNDINPCKNCNDQNIDDLDKIYIRSTL